MSKIRYVFLFLILLGGVVMVIVLYNNKPQAPLGVSFSPAFQLLGKSTSSMNVALTRLLPINEIDEKTYGEAIAESYLSNSHVQDSVFVYLNLLIKELSYFSKKRFNYRVFVISTSIPNAYAMPGGVICVTKGLLNVVKSEAQLVSILSHEMGHIEQGHCFEAIKYELTFRKMNASTIGQLADFTFNIFLRHSYSKTQENAADEYGYNLLVLTKYDPMAFSDAFVELQNQYDMHYSKSGNIITDYLETHPPLTLRILKFHQLASQWWKNHQDQDHRYIGVKNLANRMPLSKNAFSDEWTTRPNIVQ